MSPVDRQATASKKWQSCHVDRRLNNRKKAQEKTSIASSIGSVEEDWDGGGVSLRTKRNVGSEPKKFLKASSRTERVFLSFNRSRYDRLPTSIVNDVPSKRMGSEVETRGLTKGGRVMANPVHPERTASKPNATKDGPPDETGAGSEGVRTGGEGRVEGGGDGVPAGAVGMTRGTGGVEWAWGFWGEMAVVSSHALSKATSSPSPGMLDPWKVSKVAWLASRMPRIRSEGVPSRTARCRSPCK